MGIKSVPTKQLQCLAWTWYLRKVNSPKNIEFQIQSKAIKYFSTNVSNKLLYFYLYWCHAICHTIPNSCWPIWRWQVLNMTFKKQQQQHYGPSWIDVLWYHCWVGWDLPHRAPLSAQYTDSTPLRQARNNMCFSGSSHAILHMATFKVFFFFHAGFNLICCSGIGEPRTV